MFMLATSVIQQPQLARGGSNACAFGTSALINHRRSLHRVEYDKYIESSESQKALRDDEDKTKDNRKHKQGTVDFFVEKMTALTQNNPLTHTIHKAIGKRIATDICNHLY